MQFKYTFYKHIMTNDENWMLNIRGKSNEAVKTVILNIC